MNFKQCVIFREIAKTENFTKAAANLFLTQSAVSHAVRELEDEAGTRLFERLHRTVKLTKTGELFLREILPVLESLERVEARMKNLQMEAPLRVGSCITFAQLELPRLVNRFRKSMPDCPLQITVHRASEMQSLLQQGVIDIAFIEGAILENSFEMKKISSYELCPVAAPGYCGDSQLELPQLLEMDLLLRERGSAARETFESAAALKGYKIRPIWESVDSQVLIQAAKAGLGVSVLPRMLVAEEIAACSLKVLSVRGVKLYNDIHIVTRTTSYKTGPLEFFWKMIPKIEDKTEKGV